MEKKTAKYKINTCLERLTVGEYRFAMQVIPKILQVSMNTFHNYRRISLGARQDIPYEKIKMLEILFGLESGGLENFSITGKTLVQLYRGQKKQID